MKVLSFGEILFDRIEGTDYIGGAPFNFAVHLARAGEESFMLSALGNDDLGKKAREEIGKNNIREDYISISPKPTGLVKVTLKEGIPAYSILENRAWDALRPGDFIVQDIVKQSWDLVYIGSLAQRSKENFDFLHSELLPQLKAKELFFDVNLRQNYFSREVIEKSLRFATILKVNDEELPVVSGLIGITRKEPGQQAKAIFEIYPRIRLIILTLGPEGSRIFQRDTESVFDVSCNSGRKDDNKTVDTVGAGDSFSGAFCLVWHYKGDVRQAAQTASHLADFVVSRNGALPEYSDEIKKMIDSVIGKQKKDSP